MQSGGKQGGEESGDVRVHYQIVAGTCRKKKMKTQRY